MISLQVPITKLYVNIKLAERDNLIPTHAGTELIVLLCLLLLWGPSLHYFTIDLRFVYHLHTRITFGMNSSSTEVEAYGALRNSGQVNSLHVSIYTYT